MAAAPVQPPPEMMRGAADVLALQRRAGNQPVAQILGRANGPRLQRKLDAEDEQLVENEEELPELGEEAEELGEGVDDVEFGEAIEEEEEEF